MDNKPTEKKPTFGDWCKCVSLLLAVFIPAGILCGLDWIKVVVGSMVVVMLLILYAIGGIYDRNEPNQKKD